MGEYSFFSCVCLFNVVLFPISMAMEATMEIERLFFFGLQGCVKGEPVALQRHSEKTKDRLGMKPQMRRWLGFIFFSFRSRPIFVLSPIFRQPVAFCDPVSTVDVYDIRVSCYLPENKINSSEANWA